MPQTWDSSVEAIKERLAGGLDGRPLTWLAERTGDSYKNVQRWLSGPTAPPVDFVARYCEATGIAERWVLTGDGLRMRPAPDKAEEALEAVARILDGYRGFFKRLGRGLHEGEQGGPDPPA